MLEATGSLAPTPLRKKRRRLIRTVTSLRPLVTVPVTRLIVVATPRRRPTSASNALLLCLVATPLETGCTVPHIHIRCSKADPRFVTNLSTCITFRRFHRTSVPQMVKGEAPTALDIFFSRAAPAGACVLLLTRRSGLAGGGLGLCVLAH